MATMTQVEQKASAQAAGNVKPEAFEPAARALAAALAETPEHQAFDQARFSMRDDAVAQRAIRAFQERQIGLSWKLQMGLTSDAEREELQRLQQTMLAQPAVQAYMDTQQHLSLVCSEVSELVSQIIGISFAASCGPGCSCH